MKQGSRCVLQQNAAESGAPRQKDSELKERKKGTGALRLTYSFWCKQTNVSTLLCFYQSQSGDELTPNTRPEPEALKKKKW